MYGGISRTSALNQIRRSFDRNILVIKNNQNKVRSIFRSSVNAINVISGISPKLKMQHGNVIIEM